MRKNSVAVRKVVGKLVTHLILMIGLVIMIIPFLWMVTTSLKEIWEVFTPQMQWLPETPIWQNYVDAWNYAPFGRYYLNTAFVSISVVVLQLTICSLAAFALSRLEFPGRDIIFYGILGTMMLPGTIMLVPSYLVLHWLGWIDTYWALIIPAVFNAFGIFLLRQFFMTIPKDLDDAAIIDGCSRFGVLWRMIIPLSKPALAAIGLMTFMGQWNSFMWPLIVTNSENMRTITVGISMFKDQFSNMWTLMMAASTTATIPLLILFFFSQRFFIEGITLTGMKG
ncbi:MAG: carbohydrate ABC transporter permease [Firmicutes bacterium]|jgi:multiple sugar transport system permease protein|nr:carbohydrate ABC transporter permease [Bacillota bacterium]